MPAPSISSISPSAAYAGQAVTITGSYLDTVISVQFGSIYASFFYYDATTTNITAYPNLSNSGDVTVSDGTTPFSLPGFTFINEPAYVPNANSTDPVPQYCTGYPTRGSNLMYYNLVSEFTGEYFTVRDIGTSPPDGSMVDNICFFQFNVADSEGNLYRYGERNWQDNKVNALEFGIKGDGITLNGDAFQNFCTYLSSNTNGNKVGVIPNDPREIVTIYLTEKQLLITGSDVTLYIEARIQAQFCEVDVSTNGLSLILVTYQPPGGDIPILCPADDTANYISNVSIIGNGCTLDMQGQCIAGAYASDQYYCTVLFQFVINGSLENFIVLNGLVNCVRMNYCLFPVVSNVTAMGSVHGNGIMIFNDPCPTLPTYLSPYANGLVINCKAFNCYNYGITSYAAGCTRIINCESWSCGVGPAAPALTPFNNSMGHIGAGTYYYVISAIVVIGGVSTETPVSDEVSAIITSISGYNSIDVLISAVPGATGYNIYRGTSSGTELFLAAVSSAGTYSDYIASNSGGALPAVFPDGGGFSDEIDFTVAIPTGYSPNNVLFENCKAIGCKTNGLYSSSQKVRIVNFVVENSDMLPNPFVTAYQGHGISLYGNSDFIISNCDIRNIAKCGIAAVSSAATEAVPANYAGGIISNNNIKNCGNGGINVQECDTLLNCFGNNLNATNGTGASSEIAVMNSIVAGNGTAVVKDNMFTAPTALAIQIQDLNSIFVENNAIQNVDLSETAWDAPIIVRANAADIGFVTIKGNSMLNSTTQPAHIADVSVASTFNVLHAYAVANTGDYTEAGVSLALGAGKGIIDYPFVPYTVMPLGSTMPTVADLTKGDLIILPVVSVNNSLQFPPIVSGKVLTVWVQNTGTPIWTVHTGTGIPKVQNAAGTLIGTLSNGFAYRFVGYTDSVVPAWVKIN